MKKKAIEYFFYLASYDRWHESKRYPIAFFDALKIAGLQLNAFDIKDPPKRILFEIVEGVELWVDSLKDSWSKWLFGKSRDKSKLNISIHLVNRDIEPIKSRGDYHSLYGSINTENPEAITKFWQLLCQSLSPFHGFLDTVTQYNCRAHIVKPDNSIEKVTGWYRNYIPGFFAYNFFGEVYLKKWGNEVLSKLPADPVEKSNSGLFVFSPSDLRENLGCIDTYSEEELGIIKCIGRNRFRLPDCVSFDKEAPTLNEFLEVAK